MKTIRKYCKVCKDRTEYTFKYDTLSLDGKTNYYFYTCNECNNMIVLRKPLINKMEKELI